MYVRRWLLGLLLVPVLASAQSQSPLQTLKDVAQKAVLGNPEVLQRWHAYQAADGERDAAFGGYLPKLDLTAGLGSESRESPTTKSNYTLNSQALTLTQMLYDGFATRNEVMRLDHARRVRMFELYDASEAVALEAARAYFDVLRYRKLVVLAEENYVRHRSVFEQIQHKVKAGVGRGVDLEQAAGRLALAESNLLTETSNLHDVSARFQRLVGEGPAKELEEPLPLSKGVPADMAAAQRQAQQRNPTLQAAVENVRAAGAAADARKAAYQPRLDLRLRSDRGDNLSGIAGRTAVDTAEVVLSWNLFNGFSDVARSRQHAEQANVAKDIRDKACRDIRQTLSIAYNDTRKLNEQLNYLDQHQLSIEKARDAYRKQFDIGQRTLLDLLDTENELFQARRAYINADLDLAIAFGRTHAGIGNLLEVLGLSRVAKEQLAELAAWTPGAEAAEQCPPEGPQLYVANKTALDARAQEMLRESVAAAAVAAKPAADAGQSAAARTQKEIAAALKGWMTAWAGRDIEAYLAAYAESFVPADGVTRATWLAKRKAVLGRSGDIALDVADVEIVLQESAQRATTRFSQRYRSASYSDAVSKTLEWQRIDGRWLIVAETAASLH
ncbi:MAG: TolC family outer membrane protein [Gammaproteobacteria bacterium]|nr:TolC family outer membrane protein [Gammaproteobacteria bacterium]MBU1646258.1 TolC family outer membrane protein [Gammaproteobacteria bacterium]MBU1971184.1 TolC family outer membrane protein [Gammaproteobacteria bacterium]